MDCKNYFNKKHKMNTKVDVLGLFLFMIKVPILELKAKL